MSTVKFEVIEGKSKEITLGLFFKDDQPFAHGHFSRELDSLSLAFRAGERENHEISELVAAVQKVTGKAKGTFTQFVAENSVLVNSTIAEYRKQLRPKYSYRTDSKIEISGKEFMRIQQALDNDLISRIHSRNIENRIAVPTYVLEYEKNGGAQGKEEAA